MNARRLGLLLPGLLLVLWAPVAVADDQVTCQFLEISASTASEGKIAPELRPLEKKLRRPPFSAWNTFSLLSSSSRALARLKSQTLSLKLGQAAVLLREVERSSGKQPRVTLSVSVDDESGKRVVDTKGSVDTGDYLVVGRSLAKNQGHLFALTCR
jgi:hypothetical protein